MAMCGLSKSPFYTLLTIKLVSYDEWRTDSASGPSSADSVWLSKKQPKLQAQERDTINSKLQ